MALTSCQVGYSNVITTVGPVAPGGCHHRCRPFRTKTETAFASGLNSTGKAMGVMIGRLSSLATPVNRDAGIHRGRPV